jgi:hypothetical protein
MAGDSSRRTVRRKIRAEIRASENTTELLIEVRPEESPPRRVTPPGTILPGVFPPGSWPHPREAAHDRAVAEYKALRAAAGWCRECPARRNRYKHRCDACQAKERERQRRNRDRYEANRKPPIKTVKRPRRSKYAGKIYTWLKLRKRKEQHDEA